jgi:hypothetical protein
VTYQENAWCDDSIMLHWINHLWKPACEDEMLLVVDVVKVDWLIIKQM